MKKTCLFIFIFIGLLLASPSSHANASSGIFNVSTEVEKSTVTIPVASEKVEEVTVTATSPEIEEAKAVAAAPAPAPAEASVPVSYSIKKNDSLWAIAQRELGDGSRYHEIVEANKGKYPSLVSNPNMIQPGWKLEMPPKEKKQPVAEVKAKEEKGPKDVVVDSNSGTNVSKVPVLEPMNTVQKLKKLNDALVAANKKLGKNKITELSPTTVRQLIDSGSISEEEWMGMNPPEGWGYKVKDGKVTLVNKYNRPLDSDDILVLTLKDMIDNRKPEVVAEPEKKVEPKKEIIDKDLAVIDASSKQKASDESKGKPAPTTTNVAPKTDTKPAAEIKPAAKTETKPAAKVEPKVTPEVKKAIEDAKTGSDKLYADAIKEIGVPDMRNVRFTDYNNALIALSQILSMQERQKYSNVLNGYSNIIDIEKTLKSSQDTYVKKVDKNDTNFWFGNIKSAGKNVESNKDSLRKSWNSVKEAVKIAKAKAEQSAKQIKANEKKIKELEKKQKTLGYDASKAKELQELGKQIKKIESDNKNLQKDVEAYKKVSAVFKV